MTLLRNVIHQYGGKRKIDFLKVVVLVTCVIIFLQHNYWNNRVLKYQSSNTDQPQASIKTRILLKQSTKVAVNQNVNTLSKSSPSIDRATKIVSDPSSSSTKAIKTHAKPSLATSDGSQTVAVPVGGPIPKIIHQMHANLEALSPTQKLLSEKCKELNPSWTYIFWNDSAVENFIETKFAWYYPTWSALTPFIKKLDTSRYMLMHHYGGIYIDVDVECVRPFDSLVDPLPEGSAWTGDFPEPMFVMSSQGNEFWLHALDRIKRVWNKLDAWHATGPAGLNDAFREWIEIQGSGALVPWITKDPSVKFREYTKDKNNTVPWFELSNDNLRLEQPLVGFDVWKSPSFRGNGRGRVPYKGPVKPTRRIGFIANELLDPVSCNTAALGHCIKEFCGPSFPMNYLVHHCMNTWRGRIGNS